MKILVTGASGFIGSAFVVRALETTEHSLVGLVRWTDQKNQARLHWDSRARIVAPALKEGRLRLVCGDLLGDISGITEGCDAVVNFAAKTFVDHSIRDPWPFVNANVVGTYRILEDARKNAVKYFIQVSTDEVYGAILEGAYKEDARINPTNPYAASKAGADALVISYAHAFGMWTAVTRTENNYGPFQHSQKVFPVFVKALRDDRKLRLYGDGGHSRQWLWVEDHVDAILLLLNEQANNRTQNAGQVYHIAGSQELENLELARRVVFEYDRLRNKVESPEDIDQWWRGRVLFMDDSIVRPGHDRRYALVCDKMKGLGWAPKVSLDEGIKKAVAWYDNNGWWLV